MKTVTALVRRNVKLFFADKMMFLASMMTPIILITLFVTFLGQVYRDSLLSSIPEGIEISEKLIDGFVFGWLFSSLLAVCTVTVSFCSNLLMVQDKTNGARDDLDVSPVGGSHIALAYFTASAISTLIICFVALAVCLVILAFTGWYLTVSDVLMTASVTVLLVLFGTALSSIIGHFLTTQGQMSALSAIISSVYGFICGAYMPISQFSSVIRNVISVLPGTYGTSLLHTYLMRGVYRELEGLIPAEAVNGLKEAFDSEMSVFGHAVNEWQMLTILILSVLVLTAVYVILCKNGKRR